MINQTNSMTTCGRVPHNCRRQLCARYLRCVQRCSHIAACGSYVAPLVLSLFLLTGCNTSLWTSQSALAVVSQDDTSLRLQGDFNSAYYVFDSTESITIVLIEGPEDNPTQAAAIRMMWQPKAGLTPVNPDATNATIQYIVFANRRTDEGFFREVGIYSGAGFMHLDSEPGDTRLNASLWQADLLLADRSDRFKDLLGQSTLKGSFTAQRDSSKVQELLKRLNFKVSERLGYPRLVDFDHESMNDTIARH